MRSVVRWCGPLFFLVHLSAAGQGYTGSAACAQCHREIAATQEKTNMALTAPAVREFSPESVREAGIEYELSGRTYSVRLPGRDAWSGILEKTVGGRRHGISLLLRVTAIDGAALARPALIETRYLHNSAHNRLLLSPGFPEEHPVSYETALGRALSPQFETKCLGCHGTPVSSHDEPGVRCEHCHGPGRDHLLAVGRGTPKQGIVNPARFDNERKMQTCAPCHSGFSRVADPQPDDLLISNQVNALQNSECYLQSGKGISCMTCHDPHSDSVRVEARSNDACLSCHSTGVEKHAAICPVNRVKACTSCHMPAVRKGSFDIVDHWIRVHPERAAAAPAKRPEWQSRMTPKREFLKIIVVKDRALAADIRARLDKGESFFELAGRYSVDPTGPGGGYVGEMWLDQMQPRLAAAAKELPFGGTSPVVETRNGFVILARPPRDFKYQAVRLQEAASELRRKADLANAVLKYRDALRVYPHLLRGLIFLGTTLGEQGNAAQAAGVLQFAASLYPEDPAAQYNLGIAYGALGRAADEVAAYQRAVELEPDLVPAYQNLGAAWLASGQPDAAADMYSRGLQMNPLSAVLYYNLSIVRRQQGREHDADQALAAARAIDPDFVRAHEAAQSR